ncbi:MAG: DNA mismatch repair endonuclease MutL [Phycisphaerae bacterium]|jgi:DNA mismatch repair protein MutL|nr:DNA mismatch repair endonuclease MutL [Phycisphaerae bacterium]
MPTMPIRVLPTLLVNQIAAGEVVERPASVVKELVENALDAGATRIEVAIEGGGRELIRVTDDGSGIPPDELTLAVAPHATSKIARPEDLVAIGTMGFRGEALASIASVSRLSILSRQRTSDAAAELLVEGDAITGPRPASGPPGTSVVVRTLFFNTPARRKFLKSEGTEGGRIADVVESLALSHPQVAFLLRSDGRTLLDLPATDDPRRRTLDVIGREIEPKLLVTDALDGGITVWGLLGLPELAKPSAKHVRIHLNGRPIADRAILHALREAYRGLIEPARSPLAVLFLEMDPREVDVNVHPAKTEVRFRQPSAVHQAVLRAVRRSLRLADLVPAFALGHPSETAGGNGSAPAFGEPKETPFTTFTGPFTVGGAAHTPMRSSVQPIDYREARDRLGPLPTIGLVDAPASLPTPVRAVEILQVHSSFVVTQDEQGLLIVDQHALHERVMFERLLERIAKGNLEKQRLLLPTVLEVTGSELEVLGDLESLCERIGLELAAAGPRSIAVHAFPSFLLERGVDVAPFVRELLAKSTDGDAGGSEAALSEVLDMMACKAAIKAGDRLSLEELRDLLASRERIERSTNCPHGRPTSLRISIRDLERQFGRC